MKKLSYILIALAVLTGCSEIPPVIDFSEPIVLFNDTTYVTTDLPTNVKRNALIEDISGVRCNNCPKAADAAHSTQLDFGKDRVVVMTLHPTTYETLTNPYDDSKDTFNTEIATNIYEQLYTGSLVGLPTGAVNRKVFEGETQTFLPYTTWRSRVGEILQEEALAQVEVDAINTEGLKYAVNVKTTFLDKVSTPVNMSIFVIESYIKSTQKMPDNNKNKDYIHHDILREAVTTIQGIPLGSDFETGRVFEKGFEVELKDKYVPENTAIVVLLHYADGANTEVIQCTETPVTQ